MSPLFLLSLLVSGIAAADDVLGVVPSGMQRGGRVVMPDGLRFGSMNVIPPRQVQSGVQPMQPDGNQPMMPNMPNMPQQQWPKSIRVVAKPDIAFIPGNPAAGVAHSGFLMDLLSAIEKDVGTQFIVTSRPELRYARINENGTFDGTLLEPILNNEADLVGPTMTMTSYGEKVADFLVPLFPYQLEIIYNPRFGLQPGVQYLIMDTEDLGYLKTASVRNMTLQALFSNVKAGLPLSIVKDSAEALQKVLTGNFAYISEMPDPIVRQAMRMNPDKLAIAPGVIGKYFYLTFAVAKGSPLRELMNYELLKLVEEGTLGMLLDKHAFIF